MMSIVFPLEVPKNGNVTIIDLDSDFCVEIAVIGRRNNPGSNDFYIYLAKEVPTFGNMLKYSADKHKWFYFSGKGREHEVEVEINR